MGLIRSILVGLICAIIVASLWDSDLCAYGTFFGLSYFGRISGGSYPRWHI
jgi:uncharacterized membrane protein